MAKAAPRTACRFFQLQSTVCLCALPADGRRLALSLGQKTRGVAAWRAERLPGANPYYSVLDAEPSKLLVRDWCVPGATCVDKFCYSLRVRLLGPCALSGSELQPVVGCSSVPPASPDKALLMVAAVCSLPVYLSQLHALPLPGTLLRS
jgi:hypothetical protein